MINDKKGLIKKLDAIDMKLFKVMGDLTNDKKYDKKHEHWAYRLKGASVIVDHVRDYIKKHEMH